MDETKHWAAISLKPKTWRRLIRALLVYAAVPYFFVIVIFAVLQRQLMYRPTVAESLAIQNAGLTDDFGRDVQLSTADGNMVKGWLVKTRTPRRLKGGLIPLVIYFPGNSLNRKARIPDLREIAAQGFDVLIFDYRGFGDSTGTATEAALTDDAKAVWNFACEELGYQQQHIVIFGESLGGAVALSLWNDPDDSVKQPAAVILNSTFVSMPKTVRWLYPMFPFDWLLFDQWPSIERIRNVPSPVVVFHGTGDQMIPVAHGQQLADAARDGSFIEIQGGTHNDIPTRRLRTELTSIKDRIQDSVKAVAP